MTRGRVVVLGSINIDIAIRADALPRPGETVAGGDLTLSPGGKGANQAAAAARAGAEATLRGVVGAESFGLDPLARLAEYDVDTNAIA